MASGVRRSMEYLETRVSFTLPPPVGCVDGVGYVCWSGALRRATPLKRPAPPRDPSSGFFAQAQASYVVGSPVTLPLPPGPPVFAC